MTDSVQSTVLLLLALSQGMTLTALYLLWRLQQATLKLHLLRFHQED